MTIPHPYRTIPADDGASPGVACPHVCFRCDSRQVLARARLRTILLGTGAAALVMLNIASSLVTISWARFASRQIDAGTMFGASEKLGHGGSNIEEPKAAKSEPSYVAPAESVQQVEQAWLEQSPVQAVAPTSWHFEPPPTLARGVVRTSPGEVLVDREVIDRILQQTAGAQAGPVWTTPAHAGSKVIGVSIFGIRPDTLLASLGLVSGDVIQTVNGFDIAVPDKAVEAYAQLRSADHLTVGLLRSGTPMQVDYKIL